MIRFPEEWGLVTLGLEVSWATFSPCKRYRYALGRCWSTVHPPLVVVGFNPSKADQLASDPTIRKLSHFARRERCGGLIMLNVYAIRATDPREVVRLYLAGEDVIGQHNDRVLQYMIGGDGSARGNVLLAAWGRGPSAKLRGRFGVLESMLLARGAHCLGYTDDGMPKHPLYLRNDTPLQAYVGQRRAAIGDA